MNIKNTHCDVWRLARSKTATTSMKREVFTRSKVGIRRWSYNDVAYCGAGEVARSIRTLVRKAEVFNAYDLVFAQVDAATDLPVKALVHMELLSPNDPVKLWRINQTPRRRVATNQSNNDPSGRIP